MIPILLCRYCLFFYSFFCLFKVFVLHVCYLCHCLCTHGLCILYCGCQALVGRWTILLRRYKKHPRVLVNISIYYPLADSSFLSLCFKAWIQLCCTLATAWLGGCFPSITSVDQCGPTGPSCLKRSGERASGFLLGTSCTKMKYSSVCK